MSRNISLCQLYSCRIQKLKFEIRDLNFQILIFHDRLNDPYDLHDRSNIMDTHDRGSVSQAPGDGGGSAEDAILRIGLTGHLPDEAHSAGAKDHRTSVNC